MEQPATAAARHFSPFDSTPPLGVTMTRMIDSPGCQIVLNGTELTTVVGGAAELPLFDARARWKTFVPLVIAFTILNLSPVIARVAGYEVGFRSWTSVLRWETWLSVGCAIEATLLAIWLALAPVKVSERLALIGLTYVVWRTASLVGMIGLFWLHRLEFQPFWRLTLLEFSFFASLAVALGAYRYFRGWQLTGADWSGPLPPGRILRFGLLQLLVFTAGLGGYMALCKVSEFTSAAVVALVCGLAVAPIVVATLWLLFATARSRRTTVAVFGALAVVFAMVWQFTDFRVARSGPQLVNVILAWYLPLVLSLAWFRVGGWRLARPGTRPFQS